MKKFLGVVAVALISACGHTDLVKERDILRAALLRTQRLENNLQVEKNLLKEISYCQDRVRAICALYENHLFSPSAVRKPEWDRKKWRQEYKDYCFRGQDFYNPEGGK